MATIAKKLKEIELPDVILCNRYTGDFFASDMRADNEGNTEIMLYDTDGKEKWEPFDVDNFSKIDLREIYNGMELKNYMNFGKLTDFTYGLVEQAYGIKVSDMLKYEYNDDKYKSNLNTRWTDISKDFETIASKINKEFSGDNPKGDAEYLKVYSREVYDIISNKISVDIAKDVSIYKDMSENKVSLEIAKENYETTKSAKDNVEVYAALKSEYALAQATADANRIKLHSAGHYVDAAVQVWNKKMDLGESVLVPLVRKIYGFGLLLSGNKIDYELNKQKSKLFRSHAYYTNIKENGPFFQQAMKNELELRENLKNVEAEKTELDKELNNELKDISKEQSLIDKDSEKLKDSLQKNNDEIAKLDEKRNSLDPSKDQKQIDKINDKIDSLNGKNKDLMKAVDNLDKRRDNVAKNTENTLEKHNIKLRNLAEKNHGEKAKARIDYVRKLNNLEAMQKKRDNAESIKQQKKADKQLENAKKQLNDAEGKLKDLGISKPSDLEIDMIRKDALKGEGLDKTDKDTSDKTDKTSDKSEDIESKDKDKDKDTKVEDNKKDDTESSKDKESEKDKNKDESKSEKDKDTQDDKSESPKQDDKTDSPKDQDKKIDNDDLKSRLEGKQSQLDKIDKDLTGLNDKIDRQKGRLEDAIAERGNVKEGSFEAAKLDKKIDNIKGDVAKYEKQVNDLNALRKDIQDDIKDITDKSVKDSSEKGPEKTSDNTEVKKNDNDFGKSIDDFISKNRGLLTEDTIDLLQNIKDTDASIQDKIDLANENIQDFKDLADGKADNAEASPENKNENPEVSSDNEENLADNADNQKENDSNTDAKSNDNNIDTKSNDDIDTNESDLEQEVYFDNDNIDYELTPEEMRDIELQESVYGNQEPIDYSQFEEFENYVVNNFDSQFDLPVDSQTIERPSDQSQSDVKTDKGDKIDRLADSIEFQGVMLEGAKDDIAGYKKELGDIKLGLENGTLSKEDAVSRMNDLKSDLLAENKFLENISNLADRIENNYRNEINDVVHFDGTIDLNNADKGSMDRFNEVADNVEALKNDAYGELQGIQDDFLNLEKELDNPDNNIENNAEASNDDLSQDNVDNGTEVSNDDLSNENNDNDVENSDINQNMENDNLNNDVESNTDNSSLEKTPENDEPKNDEKPSEGKNGESNLQEKLIESLKSKYSDLNIDFSDCHKAKDIADIARVASFEQKMEQASNGEFSIDKFSNNGLDFTETKGNDKGEVISNKYEISKNENTGKFTEVFLPEKNIGFSCEKSVIDGRANISRYVETGLFGTYIVERCEPTDFFTLDANGEKTPLDLSDKNDLETAKDAIGAILDNFEKGNDFIDNLNDTQENLENSDEKDGSENDDAKEDKTEDDNHDLDDNLNGEIPDIPNDIENTPDETDFAPDDNLDNEIPDNLDENEVPELPEQDTQNDYDYNDYDDIE